MSVKGITQVKGSLNSGVTEASSFAVIGLPQTVPSPIRGPSCTRPSSIVSDVGGTPPWCRRVVRRGIIFVKINITHLESSNLTERQIGVAAEGLNRLFGRIVNLK